MGNVLWTVNLENFLCRTQTHNSCLWPSEFTDCTISPSHHLIVSSWFFYCRSYTCSSVVTDYYTEQRSCPSDMYTCCAGQVQHQACCLCEYCIHIPWYSFCRQIITQTITFYWKWNDFIYLISCTQLCAHAFSIFMSL